jgi:hypothetical protein
MKDVLAAFGLDADRVDVRPFGSGHINKTFRVSSRDPLVSHQFVLQKINTQVFKRPEVIARNHAQTAAWLSATAPEYLFLHPIATRGGGSMLIDSSGAWRLLPFVANTVTVDRADSLKQAREAAVQFGRFARMTDGIDLAQFEPSIPDFHNLSLRYRQLNAAIDAAQPARRKLAQTLIDAFLGRGDIVKTYETLKTALPDRLMHHDTKISNVLLRAGTFEGVCVCDLDTVMPGKVLSDLGDMVRTYVSPVSEEEPNEQLVVVRDEYYLALMDGYLSEMSALLTPEEREHLAFAGEFMVYMQGVRFLADYLNGDVYYPVKHERHNLDRTRNQWALLAQLDARRPVLRREIDALLYAKQERRSEARV